MIGKVNEIIRGIEENEVDDNTVERRALIRDSAKQKGCCPKRSKYSFHNNPKKSRIENLILALFQENVASDDY